MRPFAALCVALACQPLGGLPRPPERFIPVQRAWAISEPSLNDQARHGFLTGKLNIRFHHALAHPSAWDVGCLHPINCHAVGTVVTNDTFVTTQAPFWLGDDGDHNARVSDDNMSAPMLIAGPTSSQRLFMDPDGEFHPYNLTAYGSLLPNAHHDDALTHNDITLVFEQGAEPYTPQDTPSLQSDLLSHVQLSHLWFKRLNHMLMHPGHWHASDSDSHVAPSSHRGPRTNAFRTFAANLTAIDSMLAMYWALTSGPPTRPSIHGGNAFMQAKHGEKYRLQSERRSDRRSRRTTRFERVTRVSPVAFARWWFNLHLFMLRPMMAVSFGYHLLYITTCGPLLSHVLTAPAAATYVSILALYFVFPTLTTYCSMLLLHMCVYSIHVAICSICSIIFPLAAISLVFITWLVYYSIAFPLEYALWLASSIICHSFAIAFAPMTFIRLAVNRAVAIACTFLIALVSHVRLWLSTMFRLNALLARLDTMRATLTVALEPWTSTDESIFHRASFSRAAAHQRVCADCESCTYLASLASAFRLYYHSTRSRARLAMLVKLSNVGVSPAPIATFGIRFAARSTFVRAVLVQPALATSDAAFRMLLHLWRSAYHLVDAIDRRLGYILAASALEYLDALVAYRVYSSTVYRVLFVCSYLHRLYTDVIRLTVALTGLCRRTFVLVALQILAQPVYAGEESSSRTPPIFNGTRAAFAAWFIHFTIWVAANRTDCAEILSGDEGCPASPSSAPGPPPTLPTAVPSTPTASTPSASGSAPAPAPAPAAPPPGLPPSVVAAHAAALAAHTQAVADHKKAEDDLKDWISRNKKLYGAVGLAVPDWLKTSLHNGSRNDGVGAIAFLRLHYGANDSGDRADALNRLMASYIDSRHDVSEDDVRHQYDNMMVAVADIINAGGARPDEALLISMFENALPTSYAAIRQLTRRQNHTTLLLYYNDVMAQVRAEAHASAPVVRAFHAAA